MIIITVGRFCGRINLRKVSFFKDIISRRQEKVVDKMRFKNISRFKSGSDFES